MHSSSPTICLPEPLSTPGDDDAAPESADPPAEGAGAETRTDHELLEQFLESNGTRAEDAFATLMRRHGPMVLAVCRHVLRQHHDAEDAFQATFLVLARKASSIRARNVLARWLHEVAYRIALRARATAAQRQSYEKRGTTRTLDVTDDPTRAADDLRPVLHEEVRRLPEKYRTLVVLCYLEGKTNEEAARLLQWPIGTVKGRLYRARDLLRVRLRRRGIVFALTCLLMVVWHV